MTDVSSSSYPNPLHEAPQVLLKREVCFILQIPGLCVLSYRWKGPPGLPRIAKPASGRARTQTQVHVTLEVAYCLHQDAIEPGVLLPITAHKITTAGLLALWQLALGLACQAEPHSPSGRRALLHGMFPIMQESAASRCECSHVHACLYLDHFPYVGRGAGTLERLRGSWIHSQ